MAAYAEPLDVYARAGRLRDAFGQNDAPGEPEIQGFLDDVAGELDALISSHGVSVPVVDATATAALRGVNADGALVLALPAAFPSGSTEPAERLLEAVRGRYEAALAQLSDGTFPALAQIVSTSGVASAASSLWTDEAGYDWNKTAEAVAGNASLLPAIERGQKL